MSNIKYVWPMGNIWVYRATITNDGANSGTHEYDVVPGAGGGLRFLYAQLYNGDAVGRTGICSIKDADGGNIIGEIRVVSIAATDSLALPNDSAGSNFSSSAIHYDAAGSMSLFFSVSSLAVSKESRLGVACRIRGPSPTVTLTSPTSATEAVQTNQVFG